MNELALANQGQSVSVEVQYPNQIKVQFLEAVSKQFLEENGINAENLEPNFYENLASELLKNEKIKSELSKTKTKANLFSFLMGKALSDKDMLDEMLPFLNDRNIRDSNFENKEFKNAINKRHLDFISLMSVRKFSNDKEKQNMNKMRIKSRYEGLQEILEEVGRNGCYLLNLCTIIEEVNEKPCDLIDIARDCIENGWADIGKDFHIDYESSVAILEKYTGKKWKGICIESVPQNLLGNDRIFIIDCWLVCAPNFYKTIHCTRYFVDVSDKGEQKDIGIHLNYIVFEYEA